MDSIESRFALLAFNRWKRRHFGSPAVLVDHVGVRECEQHAIVEPCQPNPFVIHSAHR
jgi:hypothetical protein